MRARNALAQCDETIEWSIDATPQSPGCSDATVCCVPPAPFVCVSESGPSACPEQPPPKQQLHVVIKDVPTNVNTDAVCVTTTTVATTTLAPRTKPPVAGASTASLPVLVVALAIATLSCAH